jgi:hypothetical protein
MKMVHEVHFPRFRDDVATERRTLFHVPVDDHPWAVDDALRLLEAPNFPRCKVGVITIAAKVRLLETIDADLAKLCADRDAYLARWDALYPEAASTLDPVVWRIEFRYGDPAAPPEWSLAS